LLTLFRQDMIQRFLSNTGVGLKVTERILRERLKKGFPKASRIDIEDISGGCGAMFTVNIESSEFEGLSRVKQHQMVNGILAEEVKVMHGLRITTSVPPRSPSDK